MRTGQPRAYSNRAAAVGLVLSLLLNLLRNPLLLEPTFRIPPRHTLKVISLDRGRVLTNRELERSSHTPKRSTLPPTLHAHQGHVSLRFSRMAPWSLDREVAPQGTHCRAMTRLLKNQHLVYPYSHDHVALLSRPCRLLTHMRNSMNSSGAKDRAHMGEVPN